MSFVLSGWLVDTCGSGQLAAADGWVVAAMQGIRGSETCLGGCFPRVSSTRSVWRKSSAQEIRYEPEEGDEGEAEAVDVAMRRWGEQAEAAGEGAKHTSESLEGSSWARRATAPPHRAETAPTQPSRAFSDSESA
jgi:hypothetical protein